MATFQRLLNEYSNGVPGMTKESVSRVLHALSKVPPEVGGNDAVAKAHVEANRCLDTHGLETVRDVARIVATWITAFLDAAEDREGASKLLDSFILAHG